MYISITLVQTFFYYEARIGYKYEDQRDLGDAPINRMWEIGGLDS